MLKEFKAFAMKGNLLDIAVGFVMGAAFGKVSSSFTEGIVSPLVGQLVGGVNFKAMKYVITPASKAADGTEIAEVAVQYGAFLTTIVDFLIVAFVMFLVVKGVNKLKKAEAAAPPPPPPAEIVLLEQIRDLLKK